MYYFLVNLTEIYIIFPIMPTYVPILRDDISDSEFRIYFHVYYTLDLLCNPNSKYVPMYFQKISQFSFHSVIDVHILRAMICSSNYVYDWFYMCSKLFLIGKWYISICLSIIAFKPYVIGFPIIMQYCNAMTLEVCFERKIIQVSQKLLNM